MGLALNILVLYGSILVLWPILEKEYPIKHMRNLKNWLTNVVVMTIEELRLRPQLGVKPALILRKFTSLVTCKKGQSSIFKKILFLHNIIPLDINFNSAFNVSFSSKEESDKG